MTSVNGIAATYNAANQIVTFGAAPFTYDANGNLLDDGVRTYQWDAENRLVGIGYKTQLGASTLRYDGIGRRLAITEINALGLSDTHYLWCGDQICQSRSFADAVTKRYFVEGVQNPQGGSALFYGKDQIGSIRDMLTVQLGTLIAAFDYDPYGNLIKTQGRLGSDFGFAGMAFHQRSGLYFTRTRAYNAQMGAWLSRDLVPAFPDKNKYSYVSGNPISWTDPNGLARRRLDPNGQECVKLAEKIRNLQAAIYSTQQDILNNIRLPFDPPFPGAPQRLSVSGHYDKIAEYEGALKNRQDRYHEQCGGGGGQDGEGGAPVTPDISVPLAPTSTSPTGVACDLTVAFALCRSNPKLCAYIFFRLVR